MAPDRYEVAIRDTSCEKWVLERRAIHSTGYD